jgi:hypothetical protein
MSKGRINDFFNVTNKKKFSPELLMLQVRYQPTGN